MISTLAGPGTSQDALVYLNNRYHDPTLGAFVSVDPLVAITSESYVYGGANPVANSDPTGLYYDVDQLCGANHACRDEIWRGNGGFGPARPRPAVSPPPTADACPYGCWTSGVPTTPVADWTLGGQAYPVTADSSGFGTVPADDCHFLSCDIVVVLTLVGGDLFGGGSIHLERFQPDRRSFVDWLGGGSQALFFRRASLSGFDSFADAASEYGWTDIWAIESELSINVRQGGLLSALATRNRLFAAGGPSTLGEPAFAVQVFYNQGAEAVGWNGSLDISTSGLDPSLLGPKGGGLLWLDY